MILSKHDLSKPYVVERFASSLDLLDAIEKPRLKPYRSSVEYDADDFMDNMTYETAKLALVHGLERGVVKFKKTVQARTATVQRSAFTDGVAGFAPIVPRAIMGLPNDMIVDVRRPVKGKVIDMYIDTRVDGCGNAEDYERVGNALLQAIADMELQGYRCRVHAVKLATMDGYVDIFTLPLKSEFQPIDVKKFTFPLLSVAFNRRIAWKWNETSPNVQINHRGYSEYYDVNRESHKEDLSEIFGASAVFVKLEDGLRTRDVNEWIVEKLTDDKHRVGNSA